MKANSFFEWWETFTDLVYKTNYNRGLEKDYFREMYESKNPLTPEQAVEELLKEKINFNELNK